MDSAIYWIGSDGELRSLEPEPHRQPEMNPNNDYIWWDEYGSIDPQTWERFHWDKRFMRKEGPYLIKASPWQIVDTMERIKSACKAALTQVRPSPEPPAE